MNNQPGYDAGTSGEIAWMRIFMGADLARARGG